MRQHSLWLGASWFGLGALTAMASACGSTPTPPIDAQFPDAARPDAAIVHPVDDRGDPCEAPRRIMGALGTPSRVMLDTTMVDTRPRDLGLVCGNVTARQWARQEVLEYVVPGTGPVGVRVSTANMGTDVRFNTVLQIRRACSTVPTELFTCFDDVSGTDPRTEGGFTAMGGDTVFIYVTGYSEPEAVTMQRDEGAVEVTIEAGPNTAPTLAAARYLEAGSNVLITASGTDAESNFAGLSVFFYNDAGRINLAGAPNGLVLPVPDGGATMDWTAALRVAGSDVPLVDFCARMDIACTGVGIVAFDEYYAASAERRISIDGATIVGLGEACSTERLCGAGLVCNATTMVCDPSPEALAACMDATVLTIPAVTDAAQSASSTFTLPASAGTFTAPSGCATAMGGDPTAGAERVFRVDVPAGTYDLTFETDRPGTGATDTVLYVRGDCSDPGDDLGCMDDIDTAGMMYGSSVTVMDATEGDYFAFVETFGGRGGMVELQATLRPVLATGAACDPAGVRNRCAMGACAAATMVCP
ncbi:MAG: hypothetical protein ACK5U8_01335 [Deltaproteobacteria bacterium]